MGYTSEEGITDAVEVCVVVSTYDVCMCVKHVKDGKNACKLEALFAMFCFFSFSV